MSKCPQFRIVEDIEIFVLPSIERMNGETKVQRYIVLLNFHIILPRVAKRMTRPYWRITKNTSNNTPLVQRHTIPATREHDSHTDVLLLITDEYVFLLDVILVLCLWELSLVSLCVIGNPLYMEWREVYWELLVAVVALQENSLGGTPIRQGSDCNSKENRTLQNSTIDKVLGSQSSGNSMVCCFHPFSIVSVFCVWDLRNEWCGKPSMDMDIHLQTCGCRFQFGRGDTWYHKE